MQILGSKLLRYLVDPDVRLFDAAVNLLRPQLITIPGVAIPFPYGGKNLSHTRGGRPATQGSASAGPS